MLLIVARPPVLVGGLTFYCNSSIFFRLLPPELVEQNSTKTGHMLRSTCDFKMHVQSVGYTLLQTGTQNYLFQQFCNSMVTLMAYIFGTKQDIDNQASALTTTMDLLHCPKMSCTLVHKWIKIGPSFYPPYVNSAFYFIGRLCTRR